MKLLMINDQVLYFLIDRQDKKGFVQMMHFQELSFVVAHIFLVTCKNTFLACSVDKQVGWLYFFYLI